MNNCDFAPSLPPLPVCTGTRRPHEEDKEGFNKRQKISGTFGLVKDAVGWIWRGIVGEPTTSTCFVTVGDGRRSRKCNRKLKRQKVKFADEELRFRRIEQEMQRLIVQGTEALNYKVEEGDLSD